MGGIDVRTPAVGLIELVTVLDKRYRAYPVPPARNGGGGAQYVDSDGAGVPTEDGISQFRLDVVNNASTAHIFGQKKNFGTVHIDYGAYRGTAKWAGQVTLQHYQAANGDASDTDDTIRVYGQVEDGDVFDSNMARHLVWVASIDSGDLVLTVTASDDATLGDIVLVLSFRTTQEIA